MEIIKITENKKRYLDLLLLADEQEDMIDKYLLKGDMFALFDNEIKSICVVVDNGDGIYEIKNIATMPDCQKNGYGKKLINYVCHHYKDIGHTLLVGTGDSPLTIPFYEKCGFLRSHIVKNFFIDNYNHPIIECGRQLIDMIYLKKQL